MSAPIILWFRQDLRLNDNAALAAAAAARAPVVPLYIWSPEEEGAWPPGAAQRWWLHRSLESLQRSLVRRGSRLILARGPALPALLATARASGAAAVYWNDRYEPAAVAASAAVEQGLTAQGLASRRFNSALLIEPGKLLNADGRPYRIYSAFQRAALRQVAVGAMRAAPPTLTAPRDWPRSVLLETLELLPEVRWYEKLEAHWTPGEQGAEERWQRFRSDVFPAYRDTRDRPAIAGTSRLSPHLHFGEIGPRQILKALGGTGRDSRFVAELLWREFGYHLLHHFPHTPEQPLRPEFKHFPWRLEPKRMHAWQRGQTGVPLIDAGMRELWATGWMHNRVRMVVASFLVKNLMIPWQEGARWFWDTLLDADLASNSLNWQWVAGCGVDAAPFFRIFNPISQAAKFDPEGRYIEHWVPELRSAACGEYRDPIVDLTESRNAALRTFNALRGLPS